MQQFELLRDSGKQRCSGVNKARAEIRSASGARLSGDFDLEPTTAIALRTMRRKDLFIAPLGEGLLILVVALAGWAVHQPLIFASLGPTAYELIETPQRRSAQPYCIFVGHLVGVGAAYLAIFVTGAWYQPAISASGVPFLRIWAVVLGATLTVFGNLLLRAAQPAAVSTTLLIASGIMQTPKDAAVIMGAVLLMMAVGEPLRRWRLAMQKNVVENEGTKRQE